MQVLEMDLTEQRRWSADTAQGSNGMLMNGSDASTSGRLQPASGPAVDLFFEAEVMNRTENSVEVAHLQLRMTGQAQACIHGVGDDP